MQIMMVEYKKEGRKEEEGRRDKNRDTKQEKSTFFWVMQSWCTQQEQTGALELEDRERKAVIAGRSETTLVKVVKE